MEKKSKKLLIVAGVVAVVLVLLAGGLLLTMFGQGSQEPEQTEYSDMDALSRVKAQLADPAVTVVRLDEEIVTGLPFEVEGKKTLEGTGTIRFADTVNTDSALLILQEDAELTLDGVTVNANKCGNGIYVPAGSVFVLKSGTVQFANAWNVYNDGEFEMLDGVVTGAQENNIVSAADTNLAGGEISDCGAYNVQVLSGTAQMTGGNILRAGSSGIYIAEKAQMRVNGDLVRVRDSVSYGVEVHGAFTLDYGNIIKNGADNVYVGKTGTMIMNDGYIATAVTCGIKSRGVLEIHGGVIEYNGTDGVDTAYTCLVDGGSITSNTRRGFTNATGGTLTVDGKSVEINANKFGLYNEVGAVATLKDLTISNSGTNNIRNFGELYLYNYVSKNSVSVHLSTLSGSKVYMENVLMDTNSKSHGIYNYAGTIEFKNLTITNVEARGIRNIGGTVIGDGYTANGTYTTGLTNENVENKVGYVEIQNISLTGDFDYGIYSFNGRTKLTHVIVDVTNKNSLKVDEGNIIITDGLFKGCRSIPGKPDTAVYDAYIIGGTVTLNDVFLKNSYSSLLRNRGGNVTLNSCVLTGSGAAAINNSASAYGWSGDVVCNGVTFENNKSANVKNDCEGTITLNDCFMGKTKTTNVAAVQGTIIMNNSVIDGTDAEGEKVGFVVYEKATGIMKGNSIVRNTYGKGISVLGTFYMYDGTVTNCSSKNGAGLNNEGTFYVYGGTVHGNIALAGNGGAIRNKGKMYISGLTVEENVAYATGGAISNGGEMTIENTIIRNNKTVGETINGGAVYAAAGTMTLNEGTVIQGNVTNQHGGAFAIAPAAAVIVNDGVQIKENTATAGSGGAVINYGTFTMNGGSITNNTAGKHGGGVASATAGVFYFNGGSIENNTAGGNGGGVFHSGGSITVKGGSITNNSAGSLGGSAAIGSDTTVILESGTISGGQASVVPGIYVADGTEVYLGSKMNVAETLYMVSAPITLMDVREETVTVRYESYYPGQRILKNVENAEKDCIVDSIPAVTLVDCEYPINNEGYLMGDAEAGYVAKIGTAKYLSLEGAFAAAQGGETIELLNDCAVSAKIDTTNISGQITLVGNGFTVTHGSFAGNMITVRNGVTLILGKEDGTDALILDGGYLTELTEARLLGVASGGKVIVNTGSVLRNSYCTKNGGAVLLDAGELILNGGTITENTANGVGGAVFAQKSATMTIVSGTVSNNKALTNHGGALYFKASTLTMDDGSITGNSAVAKAGGAVFLEGGHFVMNGGSVAGNSAKTLSGAVHVKSSGSITVNGGSITGNTAEGVGGAITVENGNSLTINGGSIEGNTGASTNGIYVYGSATVSMGGDVVVEDICLAGGNSVAMTSVLSSDAKVNFSLAVYEAGRAVLTGDATVLEDAANKVTLTDENWMLDTNGCLKEAPVVQYAAKIQNGDSYLDLTSAVAAAEDGDVVCLLQDVTVNAAITVDKSITILGNGCTITHGEYNGNIFTVNGSLTLGDASGTDTLTVDGAKIESMPNARVFIVPNGGTLTINAGVTVCNVNTKAGCVLVQGGTVYMNGGTIKDNTATVSGAAVYLEKSSTMIMNGGEISGNASAANGGAVYIKGGSTFTMNGGKITGNQSTGKHGGAVFLETAADSFVMNSGEISGNSSASHGGAICVSKGTFSLINGSIFNNSATGNSGGVHVADGGALNIQGGTIENNTAGGVGGNIAVAKSSSLIMTGGTVGAGTAGSNGASVYAANSSAAMKMSGYATVTGQLYLDGGAVITVTGALAAEQAATVTLPSYTEQTVVLSAADAVLLTESSGKFVLADTNYKIDEAGLVAAIAPEE